MFSYFQTRTNFLSLYFRRKIRNLDFDVQPDPIGESDSRWWKSRIRVRSPRTHRKNFSNIKVRKHINFLILNGSLKVDLSRRKVSSSHLLFCDWNSRGLSDLKIPFFLGCKTYISIKYYYKFRLKLWKIFF